MATLANQLPTISELDQVISLCAITEEIDDYGGIKETVASPGTPSIRAKVRYERTNEAEGEKQERLTQEIKVWIRYGVTVTKEYRVYWKSTYWDIYGIETTPRDRYYVLKCRSIEE